ncbi:MAG: hypothetical protein KDK89_03905 [Alphaproteobacteria bacterium]|nr:hypothetical protein [Alphaproteobacteria bacterium]
MLPVLIISFALGVGVAAVYLALLWASVSRLLQGTRLTMFLVLGAIRAAIIVLSLGWFFLEDGAVAHLAAAAAGFILTHHAVARLLSGQPMVK